MRQYQIAFYRKQYQVAFYRDDQEDRGSWIITIAPDDADAKKNRFVVKSCKGSIIRKGSSYCSDHHSIIHTFMLNTEYTLTSITSIG